MTVEKNKNEEVVDSSSEEESETSPSKVVETPKEKLRKRRNLEVTSKLLLLRKCKRLDMLK